MKEPATLGRYRVVRRLGRGGMANVYLAELVGDHGFAKTVAIKTIHPLRAGDARFVAMFLDEMRVASRLSHPNVCAVLDFGTEGDTPYLVMEHLDGHPLSAVIAQDGVGIPRDVAARVIADAARGLHAAHELRDRNGAHAGIVHRDVSPQNVMLLRTGIAKVLDFGIAKASDPSGAITSSHPKGKLRYMAPEQLAGAPVDRRADLWSLGVVLFEATLGRRLFEEGATGGAAANVLSKGIPRPTSIDPAYPAALEGVVMALLKRNPERRPATASEVADALEAFLYSLGKPCGAGQVSAWLSEHTGNLRAPEATKSTSTFEPVAAAPVVATLEAPTDPIGRVEPRTEALGPPSETMPLGPNAVGHGFAELSTVILPGSDAMTPTPGPGTVTATTPPPPSASTRRARVPFWLGSGAAILALVAITTWVVTRSARDIATTTSARAVGGLASAPPIDGVAIAQPAPMPPRSSPDPSVEPAPIVPASPEPLEPEHAPRSHAPPTTASSRRATNAPAPRPATVTGSLSVNADPPAHIFLDGRALGRTPFHARPVAAGRHVLVARAVDGSATRRLVIDVPSNGHVRINPFRSPR